MTAAIQQLEYGVISILLNFNPALDEIFDIIRPEHFTDDFSRMVYVEIVKQIGEGKHASIHTIHDVLEDKAPIDELHAIAQYLAHSSRSINRLALAMVERFREKQLRELPFLINEIADGGGTVDERIDRAQVEVAKLAVEGDVDEWVDAYEASVLHLELIERRERGEIQGIGTGLADLDELLDGGAQRGNLIIIGARPAMGKSAIALTMGLHMARTHSVGFISLEMPHADVRDRMAAVLGRVPISMMKRPTKGLDYSRMLEGVEASRSLRFTVNDRSGVNILKLRSMARTLKRKKGLDVLIIDYLGLMAALDPKMLRTYQIEEITKGLKALAKDLDIVVICLVQVNRSGAETADQIPGMSNLRDSGGIEQDADVIGFIHRPIAANPALDAAWNNYALLRIAKNRQGRTGDIDLYYEGQYTLFSQWNGQKPTKSGGSGSGKSKGFSNADF